AAEPGFRTAAYTFLAPFFSSVSTIDLPMPRFAPVTRATLSWIEKLMRSLLIGGRAVRSARRTGGNAGRGGRPDVKSPAAGLARRRGFWAGEPCRTRHDEPGDEHLQGVAPLVACLAADGCDAPVRTRPRRPELEDLALDLEDVARPRRVGP